MTKKKKEEIASAGEKREYGIHVYDLESLKKAFASIKPTPIERVMAVRLLEEGYSFEWQKKIDISGNAQGRTYFVTDFYLMGENGDVVIETEGKIHATEENWEKDITRQNFLSAQGVFIFRFCWDDVMFAEESYNIMKFIESIDDYSRLERTKEVIDEIASMDEWRKKNQKEKGKQ